MASLASREERKQKLQELEANKGNGWEALATALRSLFGVVAQSEQQAEKEAAKLLEEHRGKLL